MNHLSELEQMTNLIALAADVMRKLSIGQAQAESKAILYLADDLEHVAERLVDILFPDQTNKN